MKFWKYIVLVAILSGINGFIVSQNIDSILGALLANTLMGLSYGLIGARLAIADARHHILSDKLSALNNKVAAMEAQNMLKEYARRANGGKDDSKV